MNSVDYFEWKSEMSAVIENEHERCPARKLPIFVCRKSVTQFNKGTKAAA